jgi:hypothetical protein
MVDFDKPRCVRIISDCLEAIDETLREHTDVIEYVNMDEMLKDHAELTADKEALTGLKTYLEMDCE